MSIIENYLNKDQRAEAQNIEYGFIILISIIVLKFMSEYISTKANRQTKKNKMLLEATKMKLMAQMSMAAGRVSNK
jgi:hypothetical protein